MQKTSGTTRILDFGMEKQSTTRTKVEPDVLGSQSVPNVEKMKIPEDSFVVLDSNKEQTNSRNVWKKLGSDFGDFVEKNLQEKYNMVLCNYSVIDDYKSKLEAAELKMKELQITRATSTTDNQLMQYKSQLFDKNEEISMLRQQLSHSGAIQARQIAEKQAATIQDLQGQIKSQETIIAQLQEDCETMKGEGCDVDKEKDYTTSNQDYVHMSFIDPTKE
jgi:hypothetical protein